MSSFRPQLNQVLRQEFLILDIISYPPSHQVASISDNFFRLDMKFASHSEFLSSHVALLIRNMGYSNTQVVLEYRL